MTHFDLYQSTNWSLQAGRSGLSRRGELYRILLRRTEVLSPSMRTNSRVEFFT